MKTISTTTITANCGSPIWLNIGVLSANAALDRFGKSFLQVPMTQIVHVSRVPGPNSLLQPHEELLIRRRGEMIGIATDLTPEPGQIGSMFIRQWSRFLVP
jgi:hypothetical protein